MAETVFAELAYQRPDVAQTQQRLTHITDSIKSSSSAQNTIDVINAWNDLRSHLGTMQGLAEVRFTQDVSNPAYKEEKEFFDQTGPTVGEYMMTVSKAIVESPFRAELEKHFGSLFFTRLEAGLKTFTPEIKELLVQEAALQNEYNELTAKARIEHDGMVYNLSTIAKVAESLDRDVRKEVAKKMYRFLGDNAEAFDRIYDSLVQIRHQKALALGFASFTEMRYVEMGRVDYNAADVSAFRQQVIDTVVPLVSQLRAAQAKRIGVDQLYVWDEKLHFPDGNPVAQGEHDYIVEAASKMYAELSPETHEFFNVMLDRQLMDLKSRDNKVTGGYCTSFPEYQVPFIFANFNQTSHDVEVLTHEAGHAFQSWRSRTYTVPEYQWPTTEACEIHSMSMEYLTWPWMHLFFGDQTEKFKFFHLQSAIIFLPYGCLVDEFQHWVYANPTATPTERHATWRRLESVYMPWRLHGEIPEFDEGRHWQFQRHIYESPFYYIDYTLASACAMQFWAWSQSDPQKAFSQYLKVCDIGGSMPFLGIVLAGGLRSPFASGVISEVVGDCFSWLKREYPSYF
ncbi:MAG: M3 family oligoendopeptidase [Bradyrhizobiaceae bacterium]|nr:M3 family oligoendopeptidase [Bradyrhizobiaceae bacterium]